MPVTTNLDANWGQDDNVPDRMSGVLKQLSEADADYDFRSMWGAWGRWGALSPKQAALVIWRLQVCSIEHDPGSLGLRVSVRDQDREQIAAMESWQRDRLIPYLSAEQRETFGL